MKRSQIILTVLALVLLNAGLSWAGECLMSDEDLYKGVVSFAESSKKGGMGFPYADSDLYCWSGNAGLNAKLKTVLTDLLFDSRIHPAHVATALNYYQSVFGDSKALLEEVKKKQGPSRYLLILGYGNRTGIAFSAPAAPSEEESSGEIDYIDGPANIRKGPKGALIASLPDNTKVRILKTQDKWVEIASDGVRGWTARTNLMSSHVGAADADGFYVLSRAAYMGYNDTVRFLLSHSAKADLIDGFGRNALHWAVRGGFPGLRVNELSIVQRLAALPGVNANRVDTDGMTPLLSAVTIGRLDMLNVLLGLSEIDVNLQGREGVTPLMRAIEYRRPDVIAALLNARGLNPDAIDERGRTALYHAAALGDQASLKSLLERKARTDSVTKNGKTLLHALFEPLPWRLTADPANIEIVKLLTARTDIDVNKTDEKGNTVMSLAIEQDNAALVKLLLTRPDLDVNKPTRDGGHYLHRVIGLSNLRHAHEIAMMLLDREDIDVNTRYDHNGNTLVHMSWNFSKGASNPNNKIAQKILTRNPKLEVENEYGETPLIYNINQDMTEMVRLLVAVNGIDLNHRERTSGKTPLRLARGRPEITEILKNAGAQEYLLMGGLEKSPEGIPQSLLQNELANAAITFYRDYLVTTTYKTVMDIRERKLDDAVQKQEFILDEIIVELGDSMPKYSNDQRKMVRGIFDAIKDYYGRYPRKTSKWYQALPDAKKADYAKVDALLSEVLAGKFDSLPDGELVNHPPMVPILILRDYMAHNSINALILIRKDKTAAAEQFMKDVVNRSSTAKIFP